MTSVSSPRTIKALVLNFVRQCKGHVSFEALTAEVLRHFPASQWKKSHWAWYRYQMLHGRFRSMLSDEELAALSGGDPAHGPSLTPGRRAGQPIGPPSRGPAPKDAEVKGIGDAILNSARLLIATAAGDDIDKRFKLNRWVFGRLMQDENRVKRPIKQRLWDSGIHACQACGEPFTSLKGVEIHRKDGALAYSEANCELLCRECHQQLG